MCVQKSDFASITENTDSNSVNVQWFYVRSEETQNSALTDENEGRRSGNT